MIDAGEFADADYMANPVNRCFFCKTNLYGADRQPYGRANRFRREPRRSRRISAGTGRGAKHHGVRHPYLEARIDKAAVRSLARSIGLGDLAELPAAPCLSSRVETGIPIRADMLKAIHAVERRVAQRFPMGVIRCRVRATASSSSSIPSRSPRSSRLTPTRRGRWPQSCSTTRFPRPGSPSRLIAMAAPSSSPVVMADHMFDFERRARIGLDEAVFCAGKSVKQIAAIIASVEGRLPGLLLTRLEPAAFADLPHEQRAALDYDPVSRTAIFGRSRTDASGAAGRHRARRHVGRAHGLRGRADAWLQRPTALRFCRRRASRAFGDCSTGSRKFARRPS